MWEEFFLKLSIIIPVYNTQKYLRECLNSCFDQAASKKDYEIICIDDGSTDCSPDILKEYAEKHSNFSIVRQSNQGVSAARNHGISIARGKWLWFVDSDDYIAQDSITQLLEIVSAPENATKELIEFQVNVFGDTNPQNSVVKKLPGYVFSKLFSKNILFENGISFFEKLSYSEDELFNFIYRAYIHESLFLESSAFYFYRVNRPGSAMACFDFEKRFRSFESICVWLKSDSGKLVLKDFDYRVHLYFYYINTILSELLKQRFTLKSLYSLRKNKLLKISAKVNRDDQSYHLFFKSRKHWYTFSLTNFFKKRFVEIFRFIKRRLFRDQ